MHLFMNIKSPTNVFYSIFFATFVGIFFSVVIENIFILVVVAFLSIFITVFILSSLFHIQRIFFFLLLCLGVCVGILRMEYVTKNHVQNIPQGVRRGTIITNPIEKTYGQFFVLKTDKKETVLVRTYSKTPFLYGDRIQANLECESPKDFETELGTLFNYKNYLKKDYIYSVCTTKTLFVVKHQPSIQQKLYIFSDMLGHFIQNTFSKPHSDFIGGVLVGDKTTIDMSIRNDFIKTGTIHIIALSGYNIAIVALFFDRFLRVFLKRKQTLIFSALGVIAFVAMTGFSSSALRAGLMALIVIYAGLSYQKYNPLRALLVASWCMIIYNPHYLIYDSSFHLSFLATFGIIIYTPIFEKKMKRLPKFLTTIIATTLAAYILTFPYVLYFFQGVSYVSILANIIIAPLIPILMFAGFFSLLIESVFSFGGVFTMITEKISDTILSIIHFFASFSFSYQTIQIHYLWCILLYIIIVLPLWYMKKVDLEKEI